MKRLSFLLAACAYCNATWLAVVWGRDVFWPFVAFLAIFLIPVVSGVVLFLIFHKHVDDGWAGVFVGGGVLIPVVFMFTFATRMPDYVSFVQHGRPAFDGRIADVKDDGSLFYSVRDFIVKDVNDGHFGASYTTTTRKSTTTHAKHFAIPLFANAADPLPRAWMFGSYSTGSLRVDDGAGGIYGLDQTSSLRRARADVIHGLRMKDEDARRAVYRYLKKMNLPTGGEPLVLRPVDQSAAEFYRTGERIYWMFTVMLNILFVGVCVYGSRPGSGGNPS